jgi:hypothetical protein
MAADEKQGLAAWHGVCACPSSRSPRSTALVVIDLTYQRASRAAFAGASPTTASATTSTTT